MRSDKHIALELRQQNKSYNEISQTLGIAKSTLSEWFNGDPLSESLKIQLSKTARTKQGALLGAWVSKRWQKWREEAREEAKREFSALAVDPLFTAGLMLYWAEGDSKPRNPCRFTNTDPRMIALYVKFFTKCLNIPLEKLRVTIILYPDLEEDTCIEFWSNIASIPKSQFYKTQHIKGHHPTARLANGICMISYCSRQLKEKLLVWIDLMSKTL